MKHTRRTNHLKSEAGFMVLDFIFAITIAMGFTLVFFAISYTLAMVEVTQYIAYSTSRAYAGAHESKELQADLGKRKFDELRQSSIFKPIYDMNWVNIENPVFDNFSADYPENSLDNAIFEGVQISFDAKVLDLQIPFLGRTKTKETTGKAVLNSYLMREVSTKECRENFVQQRFQRIQDLHPSYKNVANPAQKLILDNGC